MTVEKLVKKYRPLFKQPTGVDQLIAARNALIFELLNMAKKETKHTLEHRVVFMATVNVYKKCDEIFIAVMRGILLTEKQKIDSTLPQTSDLHFFYKECFSAFNTRLHLANPQLGMYITRMKTPKENKGWIRSVIDFIFGNKEPNFPY